MFHLNKWKQKEDEQLLNRSTKQWVLHLKLIFKNVSESGRKFLAADRILLCQENTE